MIIRALVCCTALIFGFLAALSATAQSAGTCSDAACGSAGKPKPLNLMSFMSGSKAGPAVGVTAARPAKTAKHRRATKTAARARPDAAPSPVAPSQEAAVSSAAVAATAEHTEGDVQVVSGDEFNSIDLAANNAAPETSGTSPGTDNDDRDRVKLADAGEIHAEQLQPAGVSAPARETTDGGSSTVRDDTWIGRFWSAIGNGFVALVAMVRHLFG